MWYNINVGKRLKRLVEFDTYIYGDICLVEQTTWGEVMNIAKVKVDGVIYNLIDKDFYDMICEEYDSSKTYEVGDYCIYEYELYKCIMAVSSPENFDSNKWTITNLAEFCRGEDSGN